MPEVTLPYLTSVCLPLGRYALDKADKINSKQCTEGYKPTAPCLHFETFICGFGGTGCTCRVLSAGAKTCDASSDDHHPEHAAEVVSFKPRPHRLHSPLCRVSTRSCRQDDAQHEEECRPDDARPPPKAIDDSSECQHAEDFTDQERVGETSLDGVRHCTVVSAAC